MTTIPATDLLRLIGRWQEKIRRDKAELAALTSRDLHRVWGRDGMIDAREEDVADLLDLLDRAGVTIGPHPARLAITESSP